MDDIFGAIIGTIFVVAMVIAIAKAILSALFAAISVAAIVLATLLAIVILIIAIIFSLMSIVLVKVKYPLVKEHNSSKAFGLSLLWGGGFALGIVLLSLLGRLSFGYVFSDLIYSDPYFAGFQSSRLLFANEIIPDSLKFLFEFSLAIFITNRQSFIPPERRKIVFDLIPPFAAFVIFILVSYNLEWEKIFTAIENVISFPITSINFPELAFAPIQKIIYSAFIETGFNLFELTKFVPYIMFAVILYRTSYTALMGVGKKLKEN